MKAVQDVLAMPMMTVATVIYLLRSSRAVVSKVAKTRSKSSVVELVSVREAGRIGRQRGRKYQTFKIYGGLGRVRATPFSILKYFETQDSNGPVRQQRWYSHF